MVTYYNDGIRCTNNFTPQLLTSTVISLFSFINQSYCSDATFLSMISFNLLCMHFNVSASAKKFHLQFCQNLTIFHFYSNSLNTPHLKCVPAPTLFPLAPPSDHPSHLGCKTCLVFLSSHHISGWGRWERATSTNSTKFSRKRSKRGRKRATFLLAKQLF